MMEKAKWIFARVGGVNAYAEFKGIFHVKDAAAPHLLKISVTGNYCVEINGKFLACARFDDYPENKFYDEIPLENIKEGKNEITILAYTYGVDNFRFVNAEAALAAEIVCQKNILFYTDENTLSRVSPRYKSGDIPKFANGNTFTAEINMKEVPCGYEKSVLKKVDYPLSPRPTERTVVRGNIPCVVKAQGVFRADDIADRSEKLQKAWLSHRNQAEITGGKARPTFPSDGVTFKANGENIYFVVDLGKESNGYLSFDLDLEKDADIEVAFGEHLDDLRVRSKIGYRNFVSVVHGVKGRNRFTDYINRTGCRYLQVYIYCGSVTVRYFGLDYCEYPVSVVPFETDNALRKKIYDVSVRTLKECMHEHYEDCPWREQALYAMDGRNQMLCGFYAFNEYRFARANIDLLLSRLRDDGLSYITAPCATKFSIPSFSLASIMMLKDYVEYSGDITLAEKLYPQVEKLLSAFLARTGKNGLVPSFGGDKTIWNFYEWTKGMCNYFDDELPEFSVGKKLRDGAIEYPSALNAFLVEALDSAAYLSEKLKTNSDYAETADKIRRAMAQTFWSEELGCFAAYEADGELYVYCELANSLILHCGAGSPSQRAKVAELLAKEGTFLTSVSLSMSMYKYEALIWHDKKYLDFVLRDIDEKWGYMLYNNATTFWETMKGADDFDYAGSLCHGWSAIPVYFYMKYCR